MGDSEVKVERKTEQEAPCSHGSLAAGHRGVVEGRPGVVDNEAAEPVCNGLLLVDGPGTEGDERCASGHEDGVAEHFELEAVFCFAKGCVGGFKGEQATPGDVVGRVNHAKHVQSGQDQSP